MKFTTKLLATALTLALLNLAGCAGTPRATGPAGQAPEKQVLAGKVVETLDAGGYTYICLEKNGEKTWAAVPVMKVTVGEELELQSGAEMGPFTSKSLNRTFDKIIFSGGPVANSTAQPAGMPSGHPPMPVTTAPDDKAAMAEKPFYSGKVVETMNSSGYTYICLEKDGKKSWAAVPATAVKVGDEIELMPGTEMGNFKSKTLNRTFDNIIFSAGIVPKK